MRYFIVQDVVTYFICISSKKENEKLKATYLNMERNQSRKEIQMGCVRFGAALDARA